MKQNIAHHLPPKKEDNLHQLCFRYLPSTDGIPGQSEKLSGTEEVNGRL